MSDYRRESPDTDLPLFARELREEEKQRVEDEAAEEVSLVESYLRAIKKDAKKGRTWDAMDLP